MHNKLLIICGPTATGKTALGILLAKRYNGEIISADSRQVYKGLDVITGKDVDNNSVIRRQNTQLDISDDKFDVGYRLKDGIPIWLVDIVEPDYLFGSGEYAVLAQKVINDIRKRGKLPIIVGGTGFYIRSIIDPFDTYMIPPNKVLRNDLEKASLEFMQRKLQEEDLNRWKNMNDSDRKNPRRLIRAIEVACGRKDYSEKFSWLKIIKADEMLMIGLRADFKSFLRRRINQRVEKRLAQGAIDEVKKLMEKKYSWFLPALTTTGALELKKFIENKQTMGEAVKSWQFREVDYAKRQNTWFKKEKRIMWFDISNPNYTRQIEELVSKWYTSS